MSHPLPKVRIVDTPGLAGTRGLQQDELDKKTIATQIKQYSHSITAVLILANGTDPRVTVGSTLSAISPETRSEETAFLLTNTRDVLYENFNVDSLPAKFKNIPQFLVDNPIALQREYLKMKRRRADLRNVVKASEQNALETLVELFDWLDGLEPARDDGDYKEVPGERGQEHRPSYPVGPTRPRILL
jgi:hypothetical protein